MQFKFAFFLLFIGASSAAFLGDINTHVAAKKHFETVSLPIASALNKAKAPKQDIFDEVLQLLLQIATEFVVTGTISDASIQALADILVDVETAIGEGALDLLIEFLLPFLDLLPQELLDVLVGLGLLPGDLTKAIARQDIFDQVLAILLEMANELLTTGAISDATIQSLADILVDVETAIGAGALDLLVEFLIPFLDLLPAEVLQILQDLGLLPAALVKAVTRQDIFDEVLALLLQMANEWLATGVISDESIQALADLLVDVETAIGAGALDLLVEFLLPFLDLLPQELIDILVGLGLLPGKVRDIIARQDIFQQFVDLLFQVVVELTTTGAISDASLQALTDLLGQIEALIGDGALDLLLEFLTPFLEFLPAELLDILTSLGLLPAHKALSIKQDIFDEVLQLLLQIATEFVITGVISDASIQALNDLLVDVETAIGAGALDLLVEFLIPFLDLLPQELLDVLVGLGLLPGELVKSVTKQDIFDQVLAILLEMANELLTTGVISDETIQSLADILVDVETAIGAGALDLLVEFLIPFLDLLPAEVLQILQDLGLLPAELHKSIIRQDIFQQFVDLLFQIVDELAVTGAISEASLQGLTDILLEIEAVLGVEALNLLIEFLTPFLDFLPAEIQDILAELGLLPVTAIAKQDIFDEVLQLLLQIATEFLITGVISDASIQALNDLLVDVEAAIGAGALDLLVEFLIPFLDLLPQELIDVLVGLGLLPGTKQDDIFNEVLNLLLQMATEFLISGTISDASIQALADMLVDIETAIGAGALDLLVEFLLPFLDLLPADLLQILTDLGLLPGKSLKQIQFEKTVTALQTSVATKDIWTELVDALMLQLVQILADLESFGVVVSDEVLAQIENFVLAVMAEGGQAWETLQALLEQYAVELNEILGDLLSQIGIVP